MGERIIFHIDANSAFLSWSAVNALQHGATVDYREIPSIVGGNQASRHGIVLAKSIPTKKYGIQTGEPVIQAKQKCPGLVVISPEYYVYMRCNSAMVDIVKDYSDSIQVFSIDEVFVDYTGMQRILGEPVQTAHTIKDRIKEELGFTVSVGISSNKLLAKMASDLKKPDAVTTLYKNEIPAKMWTLDVKDLYMV